MYRSENRGSIKKFCFLLSPLPQSWQGRRTVSMPGLRRAWAHYSRLRHAGARAHPQNFGSDGRSAGHLRASQEPLASLRDGRHQQVGAGARFLSSCPFPSPARALQSPDLKVSSNKPGVSQPLPLSQHPQPLSCSVPKHLGFPEAFRTLPKAHWEQALLLALLNVVNTLTLPHELHYYLLFIEENEAQRG